VSDSDAALAWARVSRSKALSRKVLWLTPPSLLLLFVASFPLFVRGAYFLQVATIILFYCYLSLAWNIVGGYAGQVSLGHAAFIGTGAYISTLLFVNLGVTPWLGMFVGGAGAVLVSFIMGFPSFRLRGSYFCLVTIAFAEVLRILVASTNNLFGLRLNGASGILVPLHGHSPTLFQFGSKEWYYYTMLVLLLVIIYASWRLQNSRLGYYLAAIRDDQDAAETLGIDTMRCKLQALAISAFFSALAGTFYAQLLLYIDPVNVLGLSLSKDMCFMSIVGGSGTISGPIVGAVLLTIASELTRVYLGSSYTGAHLVVYGALVILVMLYKPEGIGGILLSFYRRIMIGLEKTLFGERELGHGHP